MQHEVVGVSEFRRVTARGPLVKPCIYRVAFREKDRTEEDPCFAKNKVGFLMRPTVSPFLMRCLFVSVGVKR